MCIFGWSAQQQEKDTLLGAPDCKSPELDKDLKKGAAYFD